MVNHMKYPIIGIAGTLATGKDTVAEYLAEQFGYRHISTGDIVRELAMAEHGSIERPVLYETAKSHRESEGAGFLVKRALEHDPPLVITGLRSLGEAKALKDGGGILLFIDAPIEVRYERMRSRQRDNETALTLDGFKQNEAKEWYAGPNDSDFNLRDIEKMSDIVIDNALELEPFLALVLEKLEIVR